MTMRFINLLFIYLLTYLHTNLDYILLLTIVLLKGLY